MKVERNTKQGKCKLCKLAVSPVEVHPTHAEPFVIGGLDDSGLCEDCQQLPSELLFEWLVYMTQNKKHTSDMFIENKRLNTRRV